MLDAADVIVVPAFPARIAGKSFSAPIAALLPDVSAKRQAASTFGPIEPAGSLKSPLPGGSLDEMPLQLACPNRGIQHRRQWP